MTWLLSYLFPLAVGGFVLLLLSRSRAVSVTCRNYVFWLGIALIAGAFGGLVYVINGAPGGQITKPEPKRDPPTIEPPDVDPPAIEPTDGLVAILRAPWDSELAADWPAAEICAIVSEAAYLPSEEAESKFAAIGFAQTGTFNDASMFGYVLIAEDCAVVVFRGTDDPADWIINLNRFAARTPHGQVHAGFHTAYQPLQQQIRQLLDAGRPNYVWITGHSMGGALAVLSAYDLAENEKRQVSGLITFGQPMVARDRFAEHLDDLLESRYAHFVNESDVVPRIPPSYRHFGSLVWYINGGIERSLPKGRAMAGLDDEGLEATPDADSNEIEPLSNAEFRQLKAELASEQSEPEVGPDGEPLLHGSVPLIADHAMTLYLEKIRSFNGKEEEQSVR